MGGQAARGLLRGLSRMFAPSLFLLIWDVGALTGVVARRKGRGWSFSEPARSGVPDFGHALDEVLARLRAAGQGAPRACYLALRASVPARVDFPVRPEKPRPLPQMREMARSELEPAVAEFGALWNIGAVLAAHGLVTPEDRERVVLELAIRRDQSNTPTYFGQVARELDLVSQEDLEAALRLQEKLQILETQLACGWAGHAGEPGEPPVWLAAATGLSLWRLCAQATRSRKLKLRGVLPLAWSASETATETEGRIALEIHAEEIVAVLRHHGQIVAARNEGRMERALSTDLLLRLVNDWRASGVHTLEIVCVNPRDEAALRALLDDLAHHWGRAVAFRDTAATQRAILECLARQHRNTRPSLPVIRFGELPRAPWREAGFWHLALPLLTLLVVSGIGFRQHQEIRKIKMRFLQEEVDRQKNARMKQEGERAFRETLQVRNALRAARNRLGQIAPQVEQLEVIENMAVRLPRLLRTLAASTGDDVVLESLRNSRNAADIGSVQVVGWSNEYARAQNFATRVQAAFSGMGYAVAQTTVRAAPGRDGRPGHVVSFWLIPLSGPDELGGAEHIEPDPGPTSEP
jgi:hypothetical protein